MAQIRIRTRPEKESSLYVEGYGERGGNGKADECVDSGGLVRRDSIGIAAAQLFGVGKIDIAKAHLGSVLRRRGLAAQVEGPVERVF